MQPKRSVVNILYSYYKIIYPILFFKSLPFFTWVREDSNFCIQLAFGVATKANLCTEPAASGWFGRLGGNATRLKLGVNGWLI